MGTFKIPMFQMLVNNDDQAILKADLAGTVSNYGAGTNLDPTNAAHLFRLEKELPWFAGTQLTLLAAATRVRKTAYAAAVKQVSAYTITSAAAAKGDTFRITVDSFDLTPTVYQNIPTEKRYQIPRACTTVAQVIQAMADAINADDNSEVIAYVGFNNVTPVQDDSDKLVLEAKNTRVFFKLYPGTDSPLTWTDVAAGQTVYHTAEDTNSTTAVAVDSINAYENLKNIQWVTDLHFDRNAEYYPEVGATYNSYYWEIDWTQDTGGHSVPGQAAVSGKSQFVVYAKVGTALDTALDAFATDVNV